MRFLYKYPINLKLGGAADKASISKAGSANGFDIFSIVIFIETQCSGGDITDGHDDPGDTNTTVTRASLHPDEASLAPGWTPRVLDQPEVLSR